MLKCYIFVIIIIIICGVDSRSKRMFIYAKDLPNFGALLLLLFFFSHYSTRVSITRECFRFSC